MIGMVSATPYTYTSPHDPAREDDGLFGPGSVTWRVMNARIMTGGRLGQAAADPQGHR
jgi:uncharacterized protein (DUF2236 family)